MMTNCYIPVDCETNDILMTSGGKPVNSCFGGSVATIPKEFEFVKQDVYITEVCYNNPATIVFWSDGTKTVCKCDETDTYNSEMGLTACVLKKVLGGVEMRKLYQDWLPDMKNPKKVTIKDVRQRNK